MDRFGPTGKVSKNGSTFWGGPLFPVGPVGILVEWIAPITSWSGDKVAVKLSEVVHTVWSFRVKHKLHTQLCIKLGHCKNSYTIHFPLNLWRQSKISRCIPRFRPANRLRRKTKAVRKLFPLKRSENEIFLPLDRVGQIPFMRHCSSIPTGDSRDIIRMRKRSHGRIAKDLTY